MAQPKKTRPRKKQQGEAQRSDPEAISAGELCGLTELTDRRHRQLADEGYFPPPAKGQYKRQETLKGLFKYFRDQVQGAGRASLNAEKLRKLSEEADKLALENERTRGTLVETDAVYKHFEKVFVSFRQRVLASTLTDEEKDQLLNDLRRLKARELTESNSAGSDSQPAK